jgi:hypothetical protein
MSIPSRSIHWRSPIILEGNKTPVKMSTPTSAPKPSTPGKDRNLKLRASCDACAASKVKCSKEHPICARCSATGLRCIYGVSRKHGKPGRTRKRNADGSPFVKATKQRTSPSGRELSTFMFQSTFQQTNSEATSQLGSDWSPTPSLSTPSGFDSETAPEPSYTKNIRPGSACMNSASVLAQYAQSEPMLATGFDQVFHNSCTQEHALQPDYSDWRAVNEYIGGNDMSPVDYHPGGAKTIEHLRSASSISVPYSPMSQAVGGHDIMTPCVEITADNFQCCYPLAYSTLESLRQVSHTHPAYTKESFDAALPTIQSARDNVLRLLRCSCSSDPHLAMLYSSITSKILAWHQTIANSTRGFHSRTSVPASSPWNYWQNMPLQQTIFSPSSASSIGEVENYNLYMQSSPFTHYKIDDGEQQRHRRQLVLHELRSCRQLVEALANRGGNEQAEYLYDFLGGWLKSELYKLERQIDGREFSIA